MIDFPVIKPIPLFQKLPHVWAVIVLANSYGTLRTSAVAPVTIRLVLVLPRPLTGRKRTISHHTMAWPAIVREVRMRPFVAKRGTKYVRIEAVGMLAAFLGT